MLKLKSLVDWQILVNTIYCGKDESRTLKVKTLIVVKAAVDCLTRNCSLNAVMLPFLR